jgi:D-alanyl-D-alanine carboxypeptidase (penicillin-binding protein 5/6)
LCALVALASPALYAQTSAPRIGARAAILIEARTGRVLFARDPDRPLPPASTAKILTAWLLARHSPPTAVVRTSARAASTPGTDLGMTPGEMLFAGDLLYAMLLRSANDASVAAAESTDGSEAGFAARMNREAKSAGAASSHFVNPHGLSDPEQYTTARDLASIARAAMRDPAFADAARTRVYYVSRDRGRQPTRITNRNDLLWTFPGADGIKTGWTRAAGYCFVGSATLNGRRLISVVLHSPDWRGETSALLRYGFRRLGVSCPAAAPRASAGTAGKSLHPPAVASRAVTEDVPQDGLPDADVEATAPAARNAPGSGAGSSPAHASSNPQRAIAAHRAGAGRGARSAALNSSRAAIAAGPRRDGRLDVSRAASPSTGRKAVRIDAPWLWILLLLAALVAMLLYAIYRKSRMDSILSAVRALLARRFGRTGDTAPAPAAILPGLSAPHRSPRPLLSVPALDRTGSAEWLDHVLDSALIRNAAVRRVAASALEPDPGPWLDRLDTLLRSDSANDRLACADLLAGIRPAAAELALADLADDPGAPEPVREEAIRRLAALSRDRSEPLYLRQLIGAGSLAAASALAHLARLDPASSGALARMAAQDEPDGQGAARRALAASVLAAHDRIEPELAREALAAASQTDRDAILREVPAGRGRAPAAPLADPTADPTAGTDAGPDSEPQRLGRIPPDALIAAARIVSVRMGFTDHDPEVVSSVFQAAAAGEAQLASAPPELQRLSAAYEDPAVREAVRGAMHTDTGLPTLIGALALHADLGAAAEELAFWSDKLPAGHRLLLVHALSGTDHPASAQALEALGHDPDPLVRAAAEQLAPEQATGPASLDDASEPETLRPAA